MQADQLGRIIPFQKPTIWHQIDKNIVKYLYKTNQLCVKDTQEWNADVTDILNYSSW